MPKVTTLINKIQEKYPELIFLPGERFQFSPPNTIYYCEDEPPLLLLHELGHYSCRKYDYSSDIELVRIESIAWQEAKKHCSDFDIAWDEDFAEDRLDTYRYWHYANSLCGDCNLSGYQDADGLYHCPLCAKTWRGKYRPE